MTMYAFRMSSPKIFWTWLIGLALLSGCGGGEPAPNAGAAEAPRLELFAGSLAQAGSADGDAAVARFALNAPVSSGVAADAEGNIYVADTYNHTIRKISPAGAVITLAGVAGSAGHEDGMGAAARFKYQRGVAVDLAGNVYVADTFNYTIRKISPAGMVVTLAGTAGKWGAADGAGSAARFYFPADVAVDVEGNIYAADDTSIRKISPTGTVTTLAGLADSRGSTDGTGTDARFGIPTALDVDAQGNVYVADWAHTIRKISPAGKVTTLAGLADSPGSADGAGSAARFSSPIGIAVGASGDLYVADTGSHTIRKITPAGTVTTIAGTLNGSAFTPGDPPVAWA
jgi:hypothetical protein